jgi:SAM-dependent methyltransferase
MSNTETAGTPATGGTRPTDADIVRRLSELIDSEQLYSSFTRLRHRMNQVYAGVPVAGKTVLEIGAGSGAFSLFTAGFGARRVVAIEPESHGATEGALGQLRRSADYVGLDNIELHPVTFQEFSGEPASFDILLSWNSINHLDETACAALPGDATARRTYVELFGRMHELLANGGDLIIADCGRQNLFRWIPGVRNPIMPTVNWTIHQQPRTWIRLLEKAGFTDFHVHYRVPYVLRHRPALMDNALASFLTMSHFTLRCRKVVGLRG